MWSEGRDWGICTLSFIVLPFPLRRPISSERPSQVDLGAFYVGRRLQLFQQSLSWAMITNDSISGRKSSPWQIDSKTQATGWQKAEAILTKEKKKSIKHHAGIIWRVSSGVSTVAEGKAEVLAHYKDRNAQSSRVDPCFQLLLVGQPCDQTKTIEETTDFPKHWYFNAWSRKSALTELCLNTMNW